MLKHPGERGFPFPDRLFSIESAAAVVNGAGAPTADLFLKASLLVGRNNAPALLFDWFCAGMLTRSDLRASITHTWKCAEWPERYLPTRVWVTLFRTAGFVNDTELPAPTEAIRIYRGCTSGRRRAMAWTTDPSRARWFAERFPPLFGAKMVVVTAEVPPSGVLARMSDEDEVVVDPALLSKTETSWRRSA